MDAVNQAEHEDPAVEENQERVIPEEPEPAPLNPQAEGHQEDQPEDVNDDPAEEAQAALLGGNHIRNRDPSMEITDHERRCSHRKLP
ncbi:expressed unknown protein [Seminavis robusta]|uniref:Uncharacterized protein n=1 Tax=Seminavis robusta TaxID=568900 RepID=A0A9N8DAK0_9STRA|nr:expressed unknown protein [Seminavis robusta]|eukprot:Sro12_g009290.1 n/a (87) ;mRNA; f:82356-82616